MNRILLHVGPPKTGSTSIQSLLSAGAAHLLKAGICYPQTSPPSVEGHPSLAWEILEQLPRPIARLSQAQLTWGEAFRQFQASGAHTLLLSAEDFCHPYFVGDAMRLLRERLENLPVKIIFCLREPHRSLVSIWQQSVKWGVGLGDELLDFDAAVGLYALQERVQAHQYLRMARHLLQCDVALITVPTSGSSRILLQRFLRAAGLSEDLLASNDRAGKSERANARLGFSSVCELLYLNRLRSRTFAEESRYPQNAHRSWLLTRQLTLDHLPESAPIDPPISQGSKGIIERLRATLLELAETEGRPDLCDPCDLLAPPERPTATAYETPAEDELIALMLQVNRAAGERTFDLLDYSQELEAARDWWRRNSESFERAAASGGKA